MTVFSNGGTYDLQMGMTNQTAFQNRFLHWDCSRQLK